MKDANQALFSLLKAALQLDKTKPVIDYVEYIRTHSEEDIFQLICKLTGFTLVETNKLVNNANKHGQENWNETISDIKHFYNTVDSRILFHPFFRRRWNLTKENGRSHHYLKYLSEECLYKLDNGSKVDFNLYSFYAIAHFLETVNLPLDVLKYWDIFTGFNTNLAHIGFSKRSLLKVLIKKTRNVYGVCGYLDQALTINYIASVIDIEGGFQTLFDRLASKHYVPEFRGDVEALNHYWNSLTHGMKGRVTETSDGREWMIKLYLCKYRRWYEEGEFVNVKGQNVYVHHHTILDTFIRQFEKIVFPLNKRNTRLPAKLNVHPKVFFAETIVKTAKKTLNRIERDYKDYKFPELPSSLARLDKTKWRHLNTPLALIQEGDIMKHCVGGDSYIEAATEAHVYFHYDDGSKYGITIELCEDNMYGSNPPWAGRYEMVYEGDPEGVLSTFGFSIEQAYGRFNEDPSRAVLKQISQDLINCSDAFHMELSPQVKKERHSIRLAAAKESKYLQDSLDLYNYTPIETIRNSPEFLKTLIGKELCLTQQYRVKKKQLTFDTITLDSVTRPGFGGDYDGDAFGCYPDVEEISDRVRAARLLANNSIYGSFGSMNPTGRAMMVADSPVYHYRGTLIFPQMTSDFTSVPLTYDVNYELLSGRELVIAQYLDIATTIDKNNSVSDLLSRTLANNLLSKLFLADLTRRVRFGFMSTEEIRLWTLRIAERPLHAFAGRMNLIAERDTGVGSFNGIIPHPFKKDENTYRLNKAGFYVRNLNCFVDFNDPITQEYLGYHNSLIFK